MHCQGSYMLEQGYPDSGRPEATAGQEAHGWASAFLAEDAPKYNAIPDEEMRRAVVLYVDTCMQHKQEVFGIEQAFESAFLDHTGRGTPDFWTISPDGTLIIPDFKYGHKWVEVKENWQLILYAILIWLSYSNWTPSRVRLIVVQPRANHPDGPVREWSFDGDLLRNYRNQIQNAIGVAALPNAPCRVGGHCRYCKTIVDCHTNRMVTSRIMQDAMSAAKSELTDVEIAFELTWGREALDLLQHKMTALEAYAAEKIKGGAMVPGYEIRQSFGALQWDVKDPVAAGYEMEIDLAQPVAPITPKQALDRKLLDTEAIKFMASRKLKAPKLRQFDLNFAKDLIKGA